MGNLSIFVLIFSTFFFHVSYAYAQICLGDNVCQSQLLRVEVNNSLIENVVNQNGLPVLDNLARSTFLENSIIRDYEIPAVAFPHNKEVCQREKDSGNRNFRNVDCENPNLCQPNSSSQAVRELICFSLPCSLFEGRFNEDGCQGVSTLYTTEINFPEPLSINNLTVDPSSVSIEDGQANICLTITGLDVTASAGIGLDTRGTRRIDETLEVNNIEMQLDSPKDLCVSADFDLTSPTPISNIRINREGSEPFISNEMIFSAARSSRIHGLGGYDEDDIEGVKNDLLPVLFHPLRDQVETGITNALEGIFEEQITDLTSALSTPGSNQALYMNSSETLGMMNISNQSVLNAVAALECATLQANGQTIPSDHSCIGATDYRGNEITANSTLDYKWQRSELQGMMDETNANSADIISRLEALKPQIEAIPYVPEEIEQNDPDTWERFFTSSQRSFLRDIDNFTADIRQNRLRESTINMIGLTDAITDNDSREFSLITPELCEANSPSTHAGRRMQNCPAQAYIDLEEFNGVLEAMWESGALCHGGRGAYARMGEFDMRRFKGCFINVASGFGCYLKSAPRLSYNSQTRRYDTSIELEKCYKAPVGGVIGEILRYAYPSLESLGSFGADFNINLSSDLNINNSGNIEARNSNSTFEIVPGSESGGLLETDRFNPQVVTGINEAFSDALSQVIDIPIREMTSSMLGYPIRATGRIDSGPGFMGVCFEPESQSGVRE